MSISAVKQHNEQLFAELKGKNPRNLSATERDSFSQAIHRAEQAILQLDRMDRYELFVRFLDRALPYMTGRFCIFANNRNREPTRIVDLTLNYSSTIREMKQAAATALNIPLATIVNCTDSWGKTLLDDAYLTDRPLPNVYPSHQFHLDLI